MKLLPAILAPVLAMAAIVVASNVLVQFVIAGGPLGGLLTWGAFSYPAVFLVTDLTNRLQGPRAARTVVLWGFAAGVICSLVGSQVVVNGGPAVPLRVAVGSGAAFLLAQLLDVAIFQAFRRKPWWTAPLLSTFVSSGLDTAVFFGLAFSALAAPLFPEGARAATAWALTPAPLLNLGAEAPLWASLALADLGVKVALALLALLPYRLLLGRVLVRTA